MKNVAQAFLITILFSSLIFFSCQGEKPIPDHATVTLRFVHEIQGEPVTFDQLAYQNAADNTYSLTRLEYILSRFEMIEENGASYIGPRQMYLNAETNNTIDILLEEVPNGTYDSLIFTFGLRPEDNVSNSLPNETPYNNMFWPEPMGGGYHFMKMEGHFVDDGSTSGYAFHLGSDGFHIPENLKIDLTVEGEDQIIEVIMDINQWFETPHTYDLTTMSPYTMGNGDAMQKLVDNGKNVFSIAIAK